MYANAYECSCADIKYVCSFALLGPCPPHSGKLRESMDIMAAYRGTNAQASQNISVESKLGKSFMGDETLPSDARPDSSSATVAQCLGI